MRLRLAVGIGSALCLAAPSPVLAQDSPPPVVPPPAPPAAKPAPPLDEPAPPKGKLRLATERVTRGAVLAGDRFVVRGTLRPYVPGQKAVVRVYRGDRKVLVRSVAVLAASGTGRFRLGLRLTQPGRVSVRASHRATDQLGSALAQPLRLQVVARRATPGSRGLAVRRLQAQLARRGYVVGSRGVYDDRTARAVMAFRKLTGMRRTAEADEQVFSRLARGEGAFKVRHPEHGRHVEADITHQVMALIDRGRAVRIYPISSGASVTPTILGSFRVYLRTFGTNAKGMVNSSYFIRGYAIHGFASVPPFPASHGCLRVPVPDAGSIFAWVRYGTIVDTYYR